MDTNHHRTDGHAGLATAAGVAAILLWGSNIACSRSLAEKLGPHTAATAVLTVSAVLSLLWLAVSRKQRDQLRRLRPAYLWGCGALFVPYMPCLYLALGLAADRQRAIEVGIVNYLWPSLTLVLTVPLLGKRMRPLLWAGMAAAFLGVILAVTGGTGFSPEQVTAHVRGHLTPYALGLVCAVSWALYSVLSRRWTANTQGGAVHVFIIITAVVLLGIRCFVTEESQWSAGAIAEILYMAALPTLGAYALWEYAMREGRIVLVASLSYFIPLLSTVVSGLYLSVHLGASIWIACALVIAGAILCKVSIRDHKEHSHDTR